METIEDYTVKRKIKFIVKSHARKFVQDRDKRLGSDFLQELDRFIERKLLECCRTPNGGKKTLDATVANFRGIY